MMLCVVIKGSSFQEAKRQIDEAQQWADLLEFRVDLFEFNHAEKIQILLKDCAKPVIFTLRCQLQGGNFKGSELDRLDKIKVLAALKPHFLDLENTIPTEFIKSILSEHPDIKIIRSYHDFHETPENLSLILDSLQSFPATFYKISVMANNTIDALRLLCWKKNKGTNVIAISMGQYGQVSRILGKIIGNPITYASLENNLKTAPGQLSAKILIDRYRYEELNQMTALFGLIGDPVDQSISDITHNGVFRQKGLDAVYLKMSVKNEELSQFFQYCRELNFKGFSVTMPLKESVVDFLTECDPEAADIGTVNTIHFQNGRSRGSNTDGIGAVKALEKQADLIGKKCVVIGAGGAAKGIVYALVAKGCYVKVVNRNFERARRLSDALDCEAVELSHWNEQKPEYDVLINTTPSATPINGDNIVRGSIVMDIKTVPKMSALLDAAIAKNCKIVFGYEMFVEQALGQFALWFAEDFSENEWRDALSKEIEGYFENTQCNTKRNRLKLT